MKTIISRKLPLNVKYTVIDKQYIPLLDGYGCTCDNCGKLIANIATVKSDNGINKIGFDCLETFLINNNLLDGFDIVEYETRKKQIGQIIRLAKNVKEAIAGSAAIGIKITGLAFEARPSYASDFYSFYWLRDNLTTSRDNDCVKVKNMDFNFMLDTLKNIFPNLTIFVKQ